MNKSTKIGEPMTLAGFGLALAVLLLCAVTPSAGQTTFGTVTGTVTDPSGALIQEAGITVTNEDTGQRRAVITGGTGVYFVPDLDQGPTVCGLRKPVSGATSGAGYTSMPAR